MSRHEDLRALHPTWLTTHSKFVGHPLESQHAYPWPRYIVIASQKNGDAYEDDRPIAISNLYEPLRVRYAIYLLQLEFNLGTLEVLVQDLDLLLNVALAKVIEIELNDPQRVSEKTYLTFPPSMDEFAETT